MTASRAVYGSGYLGVYVRGEELRDLAAGKVIEVDFYLEKRLIEAEVVLIAMTESAAATLALAINAEGAAKRAARRPPSPAPDPAESSGGA